jgi:hypothetical protein
MKQKIQMVINDLENYIKQIKIKVIKLFKNKINVWKLALII